MLIKHQTSVDDNRTDEKLLLQAIQVGDAVAARRWYRFYHVKLSNLVAQKIADEKDAEEVVQAIFMSCLQHLPIFNYGCSILTWMHSIAKHEIADYYRKQYAKRAIKAIPLHELILGQALVEMQNSTQLSQKVHASVNETLGKIRQDYKELLLLKYVDRKTIKNIALELNSTVKAIEADLFRARQDFKEVYAIINQ